MFLLRNEAQGMFRLHASEDVLVEAQRTWRRNNPRRSGAAAHRFRTTVEQNLDEVIQEFPSDLDFQGRDPHDYHVHAAALHMRAHYLVTNNSIDFGDLDMLQYEVHSFDSFVCLIDDSNPNAVKKVIKIQLSYWEHQRNAGKPSKTLANALRDADAPYFAERVAGHMRFLAGVST